MSFDLRSEVQKMISRAIDSSVNYTGDEYDDNRHNWTQITTDRVVEAVIKSLPEPIDIKQKYETDSKGGILVNIVPSNTEAENKTQLDFLSEYQKDQGWNNFYFSYCNYIRQLYNDPQGVVQSDHGTDDRISRTSEGDSPNDKEPSKVR